MTEYMQELMSENSGFVVTDDQKAMWCIRKIAEAEKEAADLLKHYEEQAQKVRDRLDSTRQYFQGLLLPYFLTLPRKVTKTQESYSLPGATLVLKHQGVEYKRDTDKLLAYLKANAPEFVKTKVTESPAWDEYKKRVTVNGNAAIDTETGEVVDGVTVEERPDKFEVKIEGV
jgi:hypothetical protein